MLKYHETTMCLDVRPYARVHVADWTIEAEGDNYITVTMQPLTCTAANPWTPDTIQKTVKVESTSDYVFDLKKTKIKATGGAAGLVEFMAGTIRDHFGTAWTEKILHWIIDEMRPAKIA